MTSQNLVRSFSVSTQREGFSKYHYKTQTQLQDPDIYVKCEMAKAMFKYNLHVYILHCCKSSVASCSQARERESDGGCSQM